MSFKDWISYLIKRLLWYFETPKHERSSIRQMHKENWSVRWFGMLPFSMKMMVMQMKNRFPNRK